MAYGYLGVDVFFVISGFLITGIMYREAKEGRFSIVDFYLRRTRRIIPLVSFVCVVALVLGWFTMLPDDLENLSQSVIATNFFSNNILQAFTTKNYWDVVNEYKPLMHTWSLGIEEQYYLLYPLVFISLGKKFVKWTAPVLAIMAVVSFVLFLLQDQEHKTFYLLPYRFYELALGGILAIALQRRLVLLRPLRLVAILVLIASLIIDTTLISDDVRLWISLLSTCSILATSNLSQDVSKLIMENGLMVFIGKISFSLYMWHQLVLAFVRCAVVDELNFANLSIVLLVTVLLSVFSYYLIEQPFRKKNFIKTKYVLLLLGFTFIATNAVSFYIYSKAGVIRDVPELGLTTADARRGIHAVYNDQVRKHNVDFGEGDSASGKLKVLVCGDSFARDWSNVLLESSYKDQIELSYVERPEQHPELEQRAAQADLIFISKAEKESVRKMKIDESKLWAVGTKTFGSNNGIFYNYRGENYHSQRAHAAQSFVELNEHFRSQFPDRFVDLMGKVIDDEHRVPVFTPDGRFISQDCRHFTIDGAKYFAKLFESEIGEIFDQVRNSASQAKEPALVPAQ